MNISKLLNEVLNIDHIYFVLSVLYLKLSRDVFDCFNRWDHVVVIGGDAAQEYFTSLQGGVVRNKVSYTCNLIVLGLIFTRLRVGI